MRPGEFAIVGPQRVGENIGDDHRLTAVGGGAARSDARPDLDAVDRLDVVRRQARRGAVAQPTPVVVQQQDGAQDAAELRLDQPRQRVEDRSERRAHRDHFEDLRLAVAQQIGQTAVGDVARDAGDAEDVAARVAHRHLGRQQPGLAARTVVDVFLEVDHRPAAADDLLLVVEELLRDFQPAAARGRVLPITSAVSAWPMRVAVTLLQIDETALDVLDPEVVVEAIDQGLQRNALVEPGALVAQFGDVFVS